MYYSITLRSKTDARITGWYAGRSCLWSTDYTRQKRFDLDRSVMQYGTPSSRLLRSCKT